MTAEDRDVALGALLRDLPVPEHAPGFFADLEQRLRDDIASSSAAAADVTVPPAPADPAVPPAAPAPATSSIDTAGSIETARSRRRSRRRLLELAALGTAAAVVAVAVVLGVDVGGRSPIAPPRASAVEIARRMSTALADVRTLRGESVVRVREGGAVRMQFVLTARGDFRLEDRDSTSTYDASTGVSRGVSTDGSTVYAGERRGLAPGRPDQGPATWLLQRELGSTVRALLAAEDPAVTETTYDGKPAWQLDADVQPNGVAGDMAHDHLTVTVDQRTALPVHIVEKRGDTVVQDVRLEHLELNGPVAPGEFTLTFPPGAQVSRTDIGFRRVPLSDVARHTGYSPLVPRQLPEGYALTEVAVARETLPTGTEGINPTSLKVVSLSFRRGLDQVLVTTRLREVPAPAGSPWRSHPQCRECLPGSYWSDPLASGEGLVDTPEPLTVGGGALAGAPGQLLIKPGNVPHVWALGEQLVVTVAGDLTKAELIAALDSLAAHTA